MKPKKLKLEESHQKVNSTQKFRVKNFREIDEIFLTFQDINRSLSFLRKNEKFSDLKFVCISYEEDGSVKSNIVSAHIALFRQISPLLSELFEITDKKQVIYLREDYNLISDLT